MSHPPSAACINSVRVLCCPPVAFARGRPYHRKLREQLAFAFAPCRPRYCGHRSRPWQRQQIPRAKRPASPLVPPHLLEMTQLHGGARRSLLWRRQRAGQRLQPVQPPTACGMSAGPRLTLGTLPCSNSRSGLVKAGQHGSGACHGCPSGTAGTTNAARGTSSSPLAQDAVSQAAHRQHMQFTAQCKASSVSSIRGLLCSVFA